MQKYNALLLSKDGKLRRTLRRELQAWSFQFSGLVWTGREQLARKPRHSSLANNT